MIAQGASANPMFGTINLASTSVVSGTLPVGNGGTGAATLTGYVYGNGTSAMTASATIPESALTALSANQVLGALTAVAPSGLTMPSCSTTASALMWTSGTGFSCNTAIAAPAGSLTGTTLASNVVASSLTSVGTIASGTWQGTAITVPYGGTGLATLTSNVIYKGNGTSALAVSALTDNGTIVSSSESLDATSKGFVTEIANAGTTGTTLNALAKLTTSGAAIAATTGDTDGVVGIVTGNAGTAGNAQIAVDGQASCVFDGATTAGDFVAISTSAAGDCTDAGASRPTTSQTIGRVLITNASGGTYAVALGLNASAAGSGAVGGSGTTNYIAKWTPNGSTLGIGALYDDGSGHVGIGTTSPTDKLDVAGAVGITTTATAPTNGIYSPAANSVAVATNGSTAVTVNSSGQVGVGTASPNDKLDVNGAVKVAGTGSEGCTTATMGQMRFNPTYNYMEICQ